MSYRLAADLALLLHLLFIIFVLFGGLLVLRKSFWIWLHLPAMFWGLWVEWAGWLCPLTPLENHFRQLASGQKYSASFIEHYLVPLIYPAQLTVSLQWLLGSIVLGVNILIYRYVLQAWKKDRRQVDE